MELAFEELYEYSKINPDKIYELDENLKEKYKKINAAIISNKEYIEIINRLHYATTPNEINQIKKLFENKFVNKKEKTEEETISEIYGISLDNIEHFRLKNGDEYYKFYDMKQNRDFILKQNDKNKNLSEEFKEIQEQVTNTQKYGLQENAEEIFKYQRMYTNNEVALYSPYELETHPDLLSDITDGIIYIIKKQKFITY